MPYYNRTIQFNPDQLSLLHRIPDGECGACQRAVPLSDLTPVRFPLAADRPTMACPACVAVLVSCAGEEATRKACCVLVARLQGNSWVPTPSIG